MTSNALLLIMRWFELVPQGEDLLNPPPWSSNTIHFYRTKRLYAYKLDTISKRWIPIETLGNVAIFVGKNESVLFNTAEDGCYCNGAEHDFGIFHLEDKSIKEIYPFATSWRSAPSYLLS
ncbi:hypothetical protein M9H77_35003 [Catharanthus roseus]|uniref:Uncharacterized protein n=1 Tax=Catharanthus roseus TaxID=4058 RepID=A0ACB9ZPN4_CATRO|nr:hypothetical protein M9H77_35003 [Catharanthus roseus]